MIVYLFRHGETEWNALKKLQGCTDTNLTQRGRKAAQVTAQALKDIPFEVFYASPLKRAAETAEYLRLDRPVPVILDERIKEMHFGEYEGLLIRDVLENPKYARLGALFNDPANYHPDRGAESLAEVMQRSGEFFEEIIRGSEGKYEYMAVVAHGALINGLLAYLNRRSENEFWRDDKRPIPNCGACIFDIKNGRTTVLEEGIRYYDPDLL